MENKQLPQMVINNHGNTADVIASEKMVDGVLVHVFRGIRSEFDPILRREIIDGVSKDPDEFAIPSYVVSGWLNRCIPEVDDEAIIEVSTSFSGYQEQARKYAVYPEDYKLTYPTLGLVGEAGEVAEKVKKCIRDDRGMISEEKRIEIVKEMGDVLWYLAVLSDSIGVDLQDVATRNIEKLESRFQRNQLHGSGDNR